MEEIMKEALIGNLKSSLETQSIIAVRLDAEGNINKQEYSSEDLLNALQIFMHVLGNVSISYGIRQCYTEEQIGILATEMGLSLKQTVLLFTGIDIPSLVSRLYNK